MHNSAATSSGVRVPWSGSRDVSVPQVGQPWLPRGSHRFPHRVWPSPGNMASLLQGLMSVPLATLQ